MSAFLFLQAALYLFLGVVVLVSAGLFGGEPIPAFVMNGALTTAGLQLASGSFFLLFGVIALGIFVGFLLSQRWAWVSAITWVALSLGFEVVAYFRGDPSYASLVISVVLVIALNQTGLQKEFRGRTG